MFRLVILNNVPILEQLRLEEALLRASQENWFLLNTGSPDAIVMGISGKPEELLNLELVAQKQVPVIKRFSGGGTVYIDPQTVFSTLICNQSTFPLPMQPKPLLQWSETFYAPLFPGFALRENDYVHGEKKVGGNAQYIQKSRWLLHTSFLWDYSLANMACLQLPHKRPAYRQDRSHDDFLSPLRPLFPQKEGLIKQLITIAENTLNAQLTSPEEAFSYLDLPHRKATLKISLDPQALSPNN
jgi:lipoate-protein ligase A